jgi:hypothetical protein
MYSILKSLFKATRNLNIAIWNALYFDFSKRIVLPNFLVKFIH